MCLLGIVPKKSERQETTTAWLRDVYERNSDGFGFAWSTPSGGVHTFKSIGKFREFKKAWREMERHSGEFAFHLRMRTHGPVTKEMAHPYPIGETGMHLMHNGVLACGNAGDRTKSDTWHYINDIVLPLYNQVGEGIFSPILLDMMGDAIGNNRFVIVDKQGKLHVVNKHQGVTWNGMWLSNTYAWSASKFGYYSSRSKAMTPIGGNVFDDDDKPQKSWDDWKRWQAGGTGPARSLGTPSILPPVRSLAGPTRSRQVAVVGTLLDKDGKPVKFDKDEDITVPANGVGNPSYDFIQLLYTLGYTDAANRLSQSNVDDYLEVFGIDALDTFSGEVAEFELEDREIIDEILMRDVETEDGEDDADADAPAPLPLGWESAWSGRQMQLEDIGDRAAAALEEMSRH